MIDSLYLAKLSANLPFNNLKFSNQLYSIFVFFLLAGNLNKPNNIKFANPRKETVGIYFLHQILLLPLPLFSLDIWLIKYNTILSIAEGGIIATLVYCISWKLSSIIGNSKYSSWIGVKS